MTVHKLWKSIKAIREAPVIFAIIIISMLISLLSSHFLTKENLASLAIGLSADGIIIVGMTIVLISGGFDFSVGSVMTLSEVTAGALYIIGVNIWIASFIGLFSGLLCGYVNGLFIGKLGLNPFITTFAVMGIVRGAAYVLTQGSPISLYGVHRSFTFIGQGKLFGVPFIVEVFLLIAFIGDFMVRRSEYARKVFYTGSNERAAILSGINTVKVKMGVYILMAALAGIAGILSLSRFTVAAPASGLGVDTSMRSVSAAVIGGTSLSGGEGTVFGSVLGLILLNVINNGLILLNVPLYWQDFINGLILISAVTIDCLSHKNKILKVR